MKRKRQTPQEINAKLRGGHNENSCAVKKAEYKNHVWCWDFTMDETAEVRGLKCFSVFWTSSPGSVWRWKWSGG
jgi:hypothetical protein